MAAEKRRSDAEDTPTRLCRLSGAAKRIRFDEDPGVVESAPGAVVSACAALGLPAIGAQQRAPHWQLSNTEQ